MKLSKREKYFILVLLISIIVLIFSKLAPLITVNKNSTKENYIKTKEIYVNMSQNINMLNYYEDEKVKLKTEIAEISVLPEIKQENIIEILYKNLSSCGIEITSLNFSEPMLTLFDISTNEMVSESQIDNNEKNNNELSVLTMIVNVEFKTNYTNILEFIDKLKDNNFDIAITNIHIIKSDFNKVQGIVDVNFYAIPFEQ